jgi:hypothetical protein
MLSMFCGVSLSCMHACVYTYTRIYTYIHFSAFHTHDINAPDAFVHACMYTHVYMYICIHTHAQTNTHKYVHIRNSATDMACLFDHTEGSSGSSLSDFGSESTTRSVKKHKRDTGNTKSNGESGDTGYVSACVCIFLSELITCMNT